MFIVALAAFRKPARVGEAANGTAAVPHRIKANALAGEPVGAFHVSGRLLERGKRWWDNNTMHTVIQDPDPDALPRIRLCRQLEEMGFKQMYRQGENGTIYDLFQKGDKTIKVRIDNRFTQDEADTLLAEAKAA